MNFIEQLFERKAQGTSGESLFIQWKVAKANIPQSLETISHIFPHYSLHNESHSINILSNILRMLGMDVLEKFSIGDLWLLLSSAYYHDIGMVVTAQDKKTWFGYEKEYTEYISSILCDKNSDLYEHAKIYTVKEGKLYFSGEMATAENFDSSRYLLACFVRSKHADRAAQRIPNMDYSTLFANNIPKRLFYILAEVCRTHTLDRTKIMELPFEESSGFDIDVMHPRFIAALLRLGDLLDLDNNRISDILIESVCAIPKSSLDYNQTNRDIEHISITKQKIDLQARCKNLETADIIQSWFDWIEQEITFQMSKWSDIVPSSEYGSLPVIGKLEVILDGYESLGKGLVPKFTFNKDKVFELVQGSHLYSRKEVFVREVLQNAIDAIIMRLRLEGKTGNTYEEFKRNCKQYGEIEFRLYTKDKRWICEVKDNGIGMDKTHLPYLLEVASSSTNREKQAIVERMPVWMRPSGTFGIGFQSLFLITDEITVKSKYLYGKKTYELKMYNPIKYKNKAVYISSNYEGEIGTTVSFIINNVESKKVNGEQLNAYSLVNNFDFAKHKPSDVFIRQTLDESLMMASLSHMKIRVVYENMNAPEQRRVLDDYFDEETNLGLSVDNDLKSPELFFRNQRLYDRHPRMDMMPVYVNILGLNAKDVLTADRDTLRDDYKVKLLDDFESAICRLFAQKKYYDKLDNKKKPFISLRLKMSNVKGEYDSINNDWKTVGLGFENKEESKVIVLNLNSVLQKEKVWFKDGILNIEHDSIIYEWHEPDNVYFAYNNYCIRKLIADSYQYTMLDGNCIVCSNKMEDCPCFIKNAKSTKLYMLELMGNSNGQVRMYLPCNDKYSTLSVNRDNRHVAVMVFGFIGKDVAVMVSPFIFNKSNRTLMYDMDGDVVDYVFNHRLNANVTKEDIIKTYEIMRADFQEALDEYNEKQCKEKKESVS